jgi:hypothetical protein
MDYVEICIAFIVYLYILCDLFWRLLVRRGSQNRLYIKNHYIHRLTEERIALCSSVNRGIQWTRGHGVGQGHMPSIFIDDVEPTNIRAYIHRFHITDEYIIIFLGIDEYKVLYTLALCSSCISSINRGI